MPPFQIAQQQLALAAKHLPELDSNILEKLKYPNKVTEVFIPVQMDDGSTKVFQGFRSQHNNALGPYKGGIRFHQDVSREEVIALSMWMTWKSGLLNLPLGGGKGGIIVNPKILSENELEKLSRGYVQKIYNIIGPKKDIPAPDVNTTPEIMTWMRDEYENIIGHSEPGCFTGKPVELNGSLGRTEATGQGGIYTLQNLVKKLGLKPENTKIAIQGFGNVGYYFAKLARELGFIIIAVSDSKGGIYNNNGLDIESIHELKQGNKSVTDYPNGQIITNKSLLELKADILVPAALEKVISKINAAKIKAKAIIELANGPITPNADKILFGNNITVVPDILANSGGVCVSYFEWIQNITGNYWTLNQVNSKLKEKIDLTFNQVWNIKQDKNIKFRTACYIKAVQKIASSEKLRSV